MLVDTHAHLYWDLFKDDLDQIIKRSLDASVTTIINVGVDVELSKLAVEQIKALERSSQALLKAYSTIGIHPHEAIKYPTIESIHKDIEELEKIRQPLPNQPFDSAQGKIVAVGECGLDYAGVDYNQKNMQTLLFQAQIDLAKKLNLPLIVHCRDDRSQNPENSKAWDEVLKMIGNHPAILHCYSGLPPTTNSVLKTTNLLVSFAATITYPKNEYLREAARTLPLEKIVLETDCPFLPPQSKRGQRNEPATVLEIAQFIAALKQVSLEEVASQTTNNTARIFNI